jgi:hypothetical protein
VFTGKSTAICRAGTKRERAMLGRWARLAFNALVR